MADLPEVIDNNNGGYTDYFLATSPKAPASEVFRGNYETQAQIIKDTSLKGLEDQNATNPGILNQFDDTVFGVGNTDAFKVLSDEYESRMDNLTKQIDDYVSIAQAALKAIQDAIAQDEAARTAAQEAYDAVMADTAAYTKDELDANGKPTGNTYVDTAAQRADAQAAYNATWDELCWKPGQ